MAIYLRVSSKTREARRKLESIISADRKITGKDLLKKFLNVELKNQLSSKTSAQSIISYVESFGDSNINKFANLLLENAENQKKFKEAVKCQAYSTGTKKDSLFRKMIYQGGNLNFNEMNKSKIKAFLLAKKDSDIDENEDLGANEKRENVVEEEDKKSRRMKNKDIVAKLKSGRLSNILKVFMALVLWSYVKLKSAEVVVDDQPFVEEPVVKEEGKVQQKKAKEESKVKEEKEKENEVEKMVVNIEKICSFKTEGINLVEYERHRLEKFQSNFKNYKEENKLKEYLMKLINDKKGAAQYYKYKRNIEKVLPLLSVPKTEDLPADAQAVARLSEEDLVKDLRSTYENEYKQTHNGNLHQKVEGFRKIVNCVKSLDENIDLQFEDSFFDQKFDTPYRMITGEDIAKEWGVNMDNIIPPEYSDSPRRQRYNINNKLHKNIKNFLEKWFPNYSTADRNEPLTDYMLGKEDQNGNFSGRSRLEELMNGKGDPFSPKLFIKIIYSFEKEAKELGVGYKDFSNPTKDFEGDKNGIRKKRLKEVWQGACEGFSSICSDRCCVQLQQVIDKIALLYDVYQINSNKSNKDGLVSKDDELLSDKRFCQLLREKATNRTVANCKLSSSGGSGVDYARLLRSIFTPLVNASDSGYHSEPILVSLGETYESLAVKWKNNVSSFDLIKELYGEALMDKDKGGENSRMAKFKNKPISYNKFISIVKSINKSSREKCSDELKRVYELAKQEISNSEEAGTPVEKETLDRFEKMKNWIFNKGDFTFNDLINLVLVDLYMENIKIIDLISDNLGVIQYVMYLEDVGLIKISE